MAGTSSVLRRVSGALVAPLLGLLIAGMLPAQTFQASLTGTVRDQSGAVVPEVQVVATDVASGTRYTATSNSVGIYRFAVLPPASYRVSATVTGFKSFEQGPITLQVQQVLELNFTLEAGQVTEKVTVTDTPPPLETESATVGQVVTTRSIMALPLNVRDPIALVGLTPGVTFGGNFGNGGGNDVGRNFMKSDFNVGGGRSGSQEILLDGAPNTTPDVNRGIINPPVDSVQEFKVQSNSYDAQFGRTSGGVLNIVTKSGGNEIHGAAYDFERHSVTDANYYFNNASGKSLPSFARHQFGGNVGGAIRPNKWFFFGDYEGLRQAYPSSSIGTVPTDRQINGDFSQTFTKDSKGNAQLIKIYDPQSLTVVNGVRTRQQFPGNIIPADRINAVAKKVLSYYPAANKSADAITGQNNYIFTDKSTTNSNKYDLRTDVNITEATRMFVRFSRQEDDREVPGTMPLPAGGGRQTTDHYTQALADLTHVFSPTLVGELQANWSRALASQYGRSTGFDLSSLGFNSAFTSGVLDQFPVFSVTDITGTSNGADSFLQFQPRIVWAQRASMSWQHGKHAIKFGGEARILDFNEAQLNYGSGQFSFARTYTQGPDPVTATSTGGFGLASLLIGAASSGQIYQINPISTRSLYGAMYIQDDWKATDKLTLNIGLRWDMSTGDMEKYNRLAYFDPDAANPLASASGLPNLKGVLKWIGQGNGNQQESTMRDFGPRFGFAYQLSPKTVVRGGYGMYFLPRNVQGNGNGAVEAFRITSMFTSIDGITPASDLSNPYPTGILAPLNDRDPLANTGSTLSAPTQAYSSPYVQNWSFGVQRELPGKLVMSAYYWGSKASRLLVSWNINQLADEYLALGSKLNDQVANPFYGVITQGTLTTKTISRRQSLLPFPQYAGDSGVSQVFVPAGNSTYNAGTIQVERRLSSTFTFLSSFTRAKAIDDVRTPQDTYNRAIEKSLSGFDAPNQLLFSGVYALPFGNDRSFGRSWNKVTNAILGGWDLSGILRFQSGPPVSVSRSGLNNGTSAKLDDPTLAKWFDTSVFKSAPAYTYGNVGPYLPDVRGDSLKNVDAVLSKSFKASIRDHAVTAQFRGEIFNVTNNVQFGTPNGTVTSQSFGTVSSTANTPRDVQFALKLLF